MKTIKYNGIDYEVRDVLKHDKPESIIITAVDQDDTIVDILQVRYQGMKKTVIINNMSLPRRCIT